MTNAAFAELCPGCLTDKGTASICPHCGYDESLKRGPLVLPHRALLHQGQYLIGKVLGKPGGFGITYLALDTRLETRVAIKEYLPRDLAGRDGGHATISAHSAEDGEFFRYGLTQFLQEARTLAKFDHANIVRVRNFFEENGTGYLVMDYYDGITLADYLAQQPQGKLPEKTAVGILMPILDGLREVHAKNFLHRDIKPQNIYLTTGNRPILLDFGAARQAMGERSRSISVVLSEGYAPYEQYHRRGEQGPWTDIYACAAVLYHAVAGEAPPPATERVHKDELNIAALGVSASLAEALRLGLAVDHHKRPQRMTEFQALLLGNGEPILRDLVGQTPSKADLSAPAKIGAPGPIELIQNKSKSRLKNWWMPTLAMAIVMVMVVMVSKEEKRKAPTTDAPVLVEPVAKAETGKAPTPDAASGVAEAEIKPGKVTLMPADPVTSNSEDAETALWKSVENSSSQDDYDSYLKQYPKGKFVTLSKSRIKKLQDEAAVRQAEAQRAEAEQQEQNAWESANGTANETSYQNFLNIYPQGRYATQAQARIAKIKVEAAQVVANSLKAGTTFRDCAECPEMVVIPAGSFEMGSTNGDANEKPVHRVTLSRAFAMGKTEVTRGQFAAFVKETNYNAGDECLTNEGFIVLKPEIRNGRSWRNPGYSQNDSHPAVCLNWNDAKAYTEWLSRKTAKRYRLPSEAEWEYACRAGVRQEYCGSDNLDSVGWYGTLFAEETKSVAQKQANAFGLYDMSGNVLEWVEDSAAYYKSTPTDGTARQGDKLRILRGGSWAQPATHARAAVRGITDGTARVFPNGFRLARMLP